MIIKDDKLNDFLKSIYNLYGHDFIHYHYETLKRRISVHCIKLNINSFSDYSKLVLRDKKYFDEMFKYFSINITQFFREPDQLKLFREKVIPYLKTFSHIKIWCAGCSSGESPYSLSILLDEEELLQRTQIYATDFNNRIIAQAKEGIFDIQDFKQSYHNYEVSGGKKQFKEYFIKQGKYYKIKKYLKEHILFFNHNLAVDGVINEFQLIICKNVLIYFDDILKDRVIDLFNNSLVCNGFLIIGKSEYLSNKFDNRFKPYTHLAKIYHKKCNK